jgi:hypothetical protein
VVTNLGFLLRLRFHTACLSYVGPEYGVRRESGVFFGNSGWEYWMIYFNNKHHEELMKYMN